MLIRAEEAIQKANRVLRQCGTRNADRIARELGLIVMPRDFSRQKGAYMVIERNSSFQETASVLLFAESVSLHIQLRNLERHQVYI